MQLCGHFLLVSPTALAISSGRSTRARQDWRLNRIRSLDDTASPAATSPSRDYALRLDYDTGCRETDGAWRETAARLAPTAVSARNAADSLPNRAIVGLSSTDHRSSDTGVPRGYAGR